MSQIIDICPILIVLFIHGVGLVFIKNLSIEKYEEARSYKPYKISF